MELGWVVKHEIVVSKMSGISVGMSGRKVIEYGVNHQEPSYQHMFSHVTADPHSPIVKRTAECLEIITRAKVWVDFKQICWPEPKL